MSIDVDLRNERCHYHVFLGYEDIARKYRRDV